jgi:pentatricopeptide repeat protein
MKVDGMYPSSSNLVTLSKYANYTKNFDLSLQLIKVAHEMSKVPSRGSDSIAAKNNAAMQQEWQPSVDPTAAMTASLLMREDSAPIQDDPKAIAKEENAPAKYAIPTVEQLENMYNNSIDCAFRLKSYDNCVLMLNYMVKMNLTPDAEALDFVMAGLVANKRFSEVLEIFGRMPAMGVERDVRHAIHLVVSLTNLRRLDDAHQALIHVHGEKKKAHAEIDEFRQRQKEAEQNKQRDTGHTRHTRKGLRIRVSASLGKKSLDWVAKGEYRFMYVNLLESTLRQYFNNYSKRSEKYRSSKNVFTDHRGHVWNKDTNFDELLTLTTSTLLMALDDAAYERNEANGKAKVPYDTAPNGKRHFLDRQLVKLLRDMAFHKGGEELEPVFTELRKEAAKAAVENGGEGQKQAVEQFITVVIGTSPKEVEKERQEYIMFSNKMREKRNSGKEQKGAGKKWEKK